VSSLLDSPPNVRVGERELVPRGAGLPLRNPTVRILFPPAESQPRTMDARRDQHLDAYTPGGQLALPGLSG